jgi:hypothetical protein
MTSQQERPPFEDEDAGEEPPAPPPYEPDMSLITALEKGLGSTDDPRRG